MNLSMLRLASALMALLPLVSFAEDQQITVTLAGGASVTGVIQSNALGKSVQTFRGIRYAEAATSGKRFQPTSLVKPTGSIDATAFGNICWTDSRFDAPPAFPQSEDCLFLNVYAPVGATAESNLPVMVWTHGGSWVSGNGNIYDGRNLVGAAGNDVIYVSFNYRLGLFGFLANHELLTEGNGANAALRDMGLAHQWVRDNIRDFGGNPADITAFGESAGAFMIALQMVTNDGKQTLFDKAILESGGYPAYSQVMTVAEQDAYVSTVAGKVGCADAGNVLSCLRGVDASALSAAGDQMDWRPIVDNQFLVAMPYELVAAGKVSQIPTILGTNTDEGFLFTYAVQTDDAFTELVTNGLALNAEEATRVMDLYPAASFLSPHARAGEVIGDLIFPTYHYRFNETVQFGDGPGLAIHTAELRFVFNDPSVPADDGSKALAANVGKFWTNFATFGSPNGQEKDTMEPSQQQWPKYTADAKQQLVLQKTLTTERNGDYLPLHAERCAFWNTVEARVASEGAYSPPVKGCPDSA